MTFVTLVVGGDTGSREAAIADCIAREIDGRHAHLAVANGAAAANRSGASSSAGIGVLLEGLHDGKNGAPLDRLKSRVPSPALTVARIAPGCLCCVGNLVMRVTLNRMLRSNPAALFIGIASIGHLDGIRQTLLQPPYDTLLTLTTELVLTQTFA